jgi:uncharacterized membrane protein YecN with MAPEG domain
MMTLPIISAYAAAILGIFQVALMMTVGLARQKAGISLGDGGDDAMLMRIRRHGNFTENAPIFLILLAFLETAGAATLIVEGFAVLFILARLSHAFALSGPNKPLPARAFGAFGTIISIVGTAGTLIWQLSSLS